MKFDEIVEKIDEIEKIDDVEIDDNNYLSISLNDDEKRILITLKNNLNKTNYLIMNENEIEINEIQYKVKKHEITNKIYEIFENKINNVKIDEYHIEIEFNEIVDEFDDDKYFYYISS